MINQLVAIGKRLKLNASTMEALVTAISNCLTEADGQGRSMKAINCGPYRIVLVVRRSGK